jgi:hypothetical protein
MKIGIQRDKMQETDIAVAWRDRSSQWFRGNVQLAKLVKKS